MVESLLRASSSGENNKVNRSWGFQDDFQPSFIDMGTREEEYKRSRHVRAVQMREEEDQNIKKAYLQKEDSPHGDKRDKRRNIGKGKKKLGTMWNTSEEKPGTI